MTRPMTAAERVKVIRAQYPNPVSCLGHIGQMTYCVGGAFAHSMGRPERAPNRKMLQTLLQEANPKLADAKAMTFAQLIIWHNDNYRFEKSWRTLEAALK